MEHEREMQSDYTAELRRLVEAQAPARILCIGRQCAEIARPGDTLIDPDDDLQTRLAASDRFDLALLCDAIDHMDRRAALALLARLRDVLAARVAVLIPERPAPGVRTALDQNDLLAMGFTLGPSYLSDGKALRLAFFDISTYKPTPEWFGPQHWAHPERWDKDWW